MIFISYRIADSNDLVDRLATDLIAEFGKDFVFRDKMRLQGGQDWPLVIEKNARDCRVMLVAIGRVWRSVRFEGGEFDGFPRLHDSQGWVRREIELGLKAGSIVIPVLLNGARLPAEQWLANFGLRGLHSKQAVQVRSDDYPYDFGKLVGLLRSECPMLPARPTTSIGEVVTDSAGPVSAPLAVPEVVDQPHRKRKRGPGPDLGATLQIPEFWAPFAAPETLVVLGRFRQFKAFEPSGFLGVGDAMALAETQSYLKQFGFDNSRLVYADQLSGESLNNNLMLIGGPDANSLTDELVRRMVTPLRFGDPAKHQISMIDTTDSKVYSPQIRNQETLDDYGVIFRLDSPFNTEKKILIFFGCFAYGTWAAARFACSNAFLQSPLVRDGQAVECVVKADVVRDAPVGIRSVLLRRLQATHASDDRPANTDQS